MQKQLHALTGTIQFILLLRLHLFNITCKEVRLPQDVFCCKHSFPPPARLITSTADKIGNPISVVNWISPNYNSKIVSTLTCRGFSSSVGAPKIWNRNTLFFRSLLLTQTIKTTKNNKHIIYEGFSLPDTINFRQNKLHIFIMLILCISSFEKMGISGCLLSICAVVFLRQLYWLLVTDSKSYLSGSTWQIPMKKVDILAFLKLVVGTLAIGLKGGVSWGIWCIK